MQSNLHPIDRVNPVPNGRDNPVVIGDGTAGLVTAAGAAGLGAKVALMERGLMGDNCLHVGCVPSKALIAAARQAAPIRDAKKYGIRSASPNVDFGPMSARLNEVLDDMRVQTRRDLLASVRMGSHRAGVASGQDTCLAVGPFGLQPVGQRC